MNNNGLAILTGTILASCALTAQNKGNADTRPNFIFILTDDQPVGYLGFEGNTIIKTPNLDKLASEGVYFSNAYITSAICTPSRVSILTGQYERKHGVNFNSATSMSMEAWNLTYPVLMQNAGYYTGYIGKNHSPVGKGGYSSGVMEESFDYWYAGHNHLGFYPADRHVIFRGASSETQVEVISEGAMDFLRHNHTLEGAVRFINERPPNKPFCLSINFNLPHDAGTGSMEQRNTDPDIYKSLYRDVEIPLPPNYIAKEEIAEPKLPEEILRYKDRQTSYDYVDNPEDLIERTIRKYQSMTGIDKMVGELREKLQEQELDKNTIIIFTSDHGQFMGQFGLGGKALCYQVCTHVPFIIYDPSAADRHKGIITDELIQTIDIAPTMLSMAGINIPEQMQGKDLTPMLHGNFQPVREYIFTENLWSTHFGNPRCEAVQDKEWKYIRYYQNNNQSAREKIQIASEMGIPVNSMLYPSSTASDLALYRSYIEGPLNNEPAVYEELFHLKTDPEETINLAYNMDYQTVLEKMRQAWHKMIREARGEGPPAVLPYFR